MQEINDSTRDVVQSPDKWISFVCTNSNTCKFDKIEFLFYFPFSLN